MAYEDKTLKCRDCGQDFVFTAGEQEFYAEKGFVNEPQRCKVCRSARKQAKGELTTVICADCGVTTEVPFVPRTDRPVYCRDCFNKRKTNQTL